MFCKATGYGGTTQRAEANAGKVLDRIFTVRFDGNVASQLAWKFEPDVTTMNVKIGETALAFFRATNMSDKPLTGQAAFNVAPQTIGTLLQKDRMLLLHKADAATAPDRRNAGDLLHRPEDGRRRDTEQLSTVTLSYVFFPVENTADAAGVAQPEKTGGG